MMFYLQANVQLRETAMPLKKLPDAALKKFVRAALDEDLGRKGDITSKATIPAGKTWQAAFVARQAGVVAGLDLARLAFQFADKSVSFMAKKRDGDEIKPGTVLAIVKGNARSILSAERVALNYMSRLSGIATATHKLVEAVKPHKARISDTRKTTPTLRILEKYAVLAGGGVNHRMGLYDAILIKDNHIAAGGGIKKAVLAARKFAGPRVKIELEVDTLEQLKEALHLPLDIVLLDNMKPAMLKKAVALVKGRFETEASGGVTLETVKAIAASGVDIISAGSITHSAPALDIGLDEI
jgi:nicotinate-nucleotide pyrophosphorylase (carboxylating)